MLYILYVSNKDKFLAFRNHASDQENRIIVSGAFSRYEYVSKYKKIKLNDRYFTTFLFNAGLKRRENNVPLE